MEIIMQKRNTMILILFLIVFLFSSAIVSAEDYSIITDWMDFLYSNERNPWETKKTDIFFLDPLLQFFDCKNELNTDKDRLYKCISKKGTGEGVYQIILNFGHDNGLVLDAAEFVVSYPVLQKYWEKYKDIESEIDSVERIIKKKSYVKDNYQNTFNVPSSDVLHMIMTENAKYKHLFLFPGTVVSVGSKDDAIVLNLCSYEHYKNNSYRIVTDPLSGEQSRIEVFPEGLSSNPNYARPAK